MLLVQLVFGPGHFLGRLGQLAADLPEPGVLLHHAAVVHPLDQRLHLLAETGLGQLDRGDVFFELALQVLAAVPHDLEGGRDDFTLALGQLAVRAPAAAAAAAPTRIGRAVLAAEWRHVHEVDVGGGNLRLLGAAVGGSRIIGNKIARLELELLQEEGVARHDVLERPGSAAIEVDGLLRLAVHRIDQLEILDAVVILRARLGEDLFDRRGARVAAGLGEVHRGRAVGEHVDRVIRRRHRQGAVWPLELDLVEPRPVHRERGAQMAVGSHGERDRGFALDPNLSRGRLERGRRPDLHLCTGEGGDIAAVFDLLHREPAVRRIVILQVHLLHVGDVGDLDAIERRPHAARFHEVVGGRVHAQHEESVVAGRVVPHHRQPLPLGGAAAPEGNVHLVALKPRSEAPTFWSAPRASRVLPGFTSMA